MSLKRMAREKLVEKDIEWKQVYTDKTLFLKEQFEDIIGPGSYFRFEGYSSDGDSYYCIIGPAKIHNPIAKFFAGDRKLPATFSAGGKYFDSLDGAASYARETWGVETPRSLRPYTSASLRGLADKVEKWKKQRKEDDESGKNEDSEETKEASISLDFIIKEAADDYGADYEASRPKRLVPNAPVKVRNQQFEELMERREGVEWNGVMEEYGGDVVDTLHEEYIRLTGVGSQVGELSWDDRSTVENVDRRSPLTVLDLVKATDDILAKNPRVEGLRFDEATGTYRMDVPGKREGYITIGARKGYHDLISNTREKYLQSNNETEDRGEYVGETTQNLRESPLEELDWGDDFDDALADLGSFSYTNKEKVVLSKTINNLITIAADCDNKGDTLGAEEIHRVIRKYKEEVI